MQHKKDFAEYLLGLQGIIKCQGPQLRQKKSSPEV
jgi:hypothetical protein